jgi:hypothetical protein
VRPHQLVGSKRQPLRERHVFESGAPEHLQESVIFPSKVPGSLAYANLGVNSTPEVTRKNALLTFGISRISASLHCRYHRIRPFRR